MRRALCLLSLLALLLAGSGAPSPMSLSALDPAEPAGYLEAGEVLAATAGTPDQIRRARQTLALGLALAHRNGQSTLAASMAIALADAESDPDRSIELWDLALLLDPDRQRAWGTRRVELVKRVRGAQHDAARAIYLVRNGDARQAAALLDKPATRDAIAAAAKAHDIDSQRFLQTLESLLAHAREDPCRGRVFDIRPQEGEPYRFVCRAHQRPLGAGPDDRTLRSMITLELALLAPEAQRPPLDDWAALAYAGRLRAAREPSVERMLEAYGVDPIRPNWNGQEWSDRP